jgi:hypothetical protein
VPKEPFLFLDAVHPRVEAVEAGHCPHAMRSFARCRDPTCIPLAREVFHGIDIPFLLHLFFLYFESEENREFLFKKNIVKVIHILRGRMLLLIYLFFLFFSTKAFFPLIEERREKREKKMTSFATVDSIIVRRGRESFYVCTQPQQTISALKESICQFFEGATPANSRLLFKREVMAEEKTVGDFKMHNTPSQELLIPSVRFQMIDPNTEDWEILSIFEAEVHPVSDEALAVMAEMASKVKK